MNWGKVWDKIKKGFRAYADGMAETHKEKRLRCSNPFYDLTKSINELNIKLDRLSQTLEDKRE